MIVKVFKEADEMIENDGKVVYVCSPYAGNIKHNTENARMYSRFVVESGHIPLAVHLLFPQFVSEKDERELAIQMGLDLLSRADEMWVFGSNISEGMSKEIVCAVARDIKVRFFTEDLQEVE